MIVRWPEQWGLTTRLTLAVLGLLLLLQLIALVAYRSTLDERRAAEMRNAVAIGQSAASVVQGFVRDLETLSLSATLAVGTSERGIRQERYGPYLAAIQAEYGVLRSLFCHRSIRPDRGLSDRRPPGT